MKKDKQQAWLLQDDIGVTQEIHQPLTLINWNIQTQRHRHHQFSNNYHQPSNNPDQQNSGQLVWFDLREQLQQDQLLGSILQRGTRRPEQGVSSESSTPRREVLEDEWYSYNHLSRTVYHETPGFKSYIKSPFKKFVQKFNLTTLATLSKNSYSGDKDILEEIQPTQSPEGYLQKPVFFFIGIGNFFKKRGHIYQSLFFYKLAVYIDPFCHRGWSKLIQGLVERGLYREATAMAKTSFLFKPHSTSGELYLQLGDKAEVSSHQLRGILPALKNPENWEKIVFACAQLEIKKRKVGRGLVLLQQYCRMCEYKTNIGHGVILVAKIYQNYFKNMEKALKYLHIAIKHGCTKFQAFLMYLEYVRHFYTSNPNLMNNLHGDIQWILNYKGQLTKQTLYKLYLELADLVFTSKVPNYLQEAQRYLKLAHDSAIADCRPGLGRDRALRCIYFAVLSFKGDNPPKQKLIQHPNDNHLWFMENRARYIRGQPIIRHQFTDWKYYLHYTLAKDHTYLIKASQQWPQSGRLIAEWIHTLRTVAKPLKMLAIWRTKIEEVPKSGQLWCEGGRIYRDLGQFENACKCFKAALHFTPQYGDSYLEHLSYLLKFFHYHEVNQLYKSFIINQPFIGNVLSFLRQGHRTLAQIWQNATIEIKDSLSSGQSGPNFNLTASQSYNTAFMNPNTPFLRQALFASYQQLQNKLQKH